ncbi:MAG: hypothetical protein OXG35_12690 [Acidobacteria bacterium]|nr:hypothetical protein [Acidobacteriota bacterium]
MKSRPSWGLDPSSGNSDGETLAPDRVAPSRLADRAEISWYPASCSNDSAFSSSRGIERFDSHMSDPPTDPSDSPMRTIAAASGYGSGRSRTP